jgi:hypothetical protein
VDTEKYENNQAASDLMTELKKGRISGEQEGWSSLEEVRKETINQLSKLEQAATLAQKVYITDSEPAVFTALAGDDFHGTS